jgi:putative transposase
LEKSYKYRIYPNQQQEELIQKTFGCSRFVYNYYLAKRIEIYKQDKSTISCYDCFKDLKNTKHEFNWLRG